MPVIREYQPEEAQQIEACFVALQDFLHRLDPQVLEGQAARPYLDFMLASCRKTSGKIFVAEVEKQIVGFVCLWLKVQSDELDEEPAEYAFISDLVILPAYRGRGLGRMLLQTAEEYARRHGATALKLEVLAKNEGALSLYQRHGFSAYQLLLVKNLDS